MAKQDNNVKKLNPRSPDVQHTGEEPQWETQPGEVGRIGAMAKAFSWYNYFYGKKDAKEMIAQYLDVSGRKREAKQMRAVPDSQVRVTIGWVCRMSMVGLVLTDHEKGLVEEQIAELLKVKQEVKEVAEDKPDTAQVKLTIQDHLREKASECAGELEGMFDDFIDAGAKMTADFKPIALIRGMNISPQMIPNITAVWNLRLEEYNEVLTGKDAQLVEGYSHLNKTQLKQCVKFCETVLADCQSYISIKKVERKPRAKKTISPEKTVSKFKYLKEFAELKLKSEHPAKLVGATEAWLYDTAKRKLIHVMADSHLGTFTVKGSAVITFDTLTTVQKTLRKPAEQLKSVTSVGKPAARKAFESIKSTPTQWNGRGNENLIILKAW